MPKIIFNTDNSPITMSFLLPPLWKETLDEIVAASPTPTNRSTIIREALEPLITKYLSIKKEQEEK